MIPEFLKTKQNITIKKPINRYGFLNKTIKKAATVIINVSSINYTFNKKGILQNIDARIKLICLISGIVLISLNHNILYQFTVLLFNLFFIFNSNINPIKILKKAIIPAIFFGLIVTLPSSLNVFIEGKPLLLLFDLKEEHKFLIYNIPKEIYVTREGILYVLKITLKILNSVTLTFLIILTTGFDNIIKAMSFYKIPPIINLTIILSFQFIIVLSKTLLSAYQAIKLRWFSRMNPEEINKIISGRIGYIFRKAFMKYEKVYNSMILRGFDEKFNFFYFEKIKPKDYLFLLVFLAIFSILFFL